LSDFRRGAPLPLCSVQICFESAIYERSSTAKSS
jgi:hypothetical protein